MNILLDDTKLLLLLSEKREHIGRNYDILGVSLPAVTYIISLFCSDFHDILFINASTIRGFAYFLAFIYSFDLLRRIVMNAVNKYDHKMLYKDIKDMNQITHDFSLIAIKDEYNDFPNHLLLYYDQRWKCWFFPNFKTQEDDNESFVKEKLSNTLHIKKDAISLECVGEKIQPKFSRSDQVNKVYAHRLYKGTISEFPRELQADTFMIDDVKYRWMTIPEMETDQIINEVNGDVVSFVKEIIK